MTVHRSAAPSARTQPRGCARRASSGASWPTGRSSAGSYAVGANVVGLGVLPERRADFDHCNLLRVHRQLPAVRQVLRDELVIALLRFGVVVGAEVDAAPVELDETPSRSSLSTFRRCLVTAIRGGAWYLVSRHRYGLLFCRAVNLTARGSGLRPHDRIGRYP
jgi:hypothetical protein